MNSVIQAIMTTFNNLSIQFSSFLSAPSTPTLAMYASLALVLILLLVLIIYFIVKIVHTVSGNEPKPKKEKPAKAKKSREKKAKKKRHSRPSDEDEENEDDFIPESIEDRPREQTRKVNISPTVAERRDLAASVSAPQNPAAFPAPELINPELAAVREEPPVPPPAPLPVPAVQPQMEQEPAPQPVQEPAPEPVPEQPSASAPSLKEEAPAPASEKTPSEPSVETVSEAPGAPAAAPQPPADSDSSSEDEEDEEEIIERFGPFGLFKRKKKQRKTKNQISDLELIGVADEMASLRGIEERKAAARKELTPREQKREAKKAKKTLKKKGKKLQIPTTVQKTIPYEAVYAEDGIIEIKPGIFTRCYLLGDVNYSIAKDDEQHDMFMKFGQVLNGFDPTMKFEITINQKNINMGEFEDHVMLKLRGDELDELRIERNEMLRKKIMEGKNHLVKEKYITVSVPADSYEQAQTIFLRLDSELDTNIKKIGNATVTPLSASKRLEILHDIYNIGDEGLFGNNMVRHVNEDGSVEYKFAEEKFRFDLMRRMGLTTKDMVGPPSFEFKGDYGRVGDMYFRALFVRSIPSFLTDNVLDELTKAECNMLTSLHYVAIDGEKAQKMVRNQITNLNANMIDKQKKASKSGYSVELISPELRDATAETNALLEDINSKNQKLFYVTIVFVHFAKTKKQLDQDTKAIQTIGQRFTLDIKRLNQQQENGLNTALPLANNQIAIKRALTTESAAVFMPFVNQELNDKNGIYYGNNAVSHNLIMFDRRACKNGNGFIFGTPGAGKSMSAKQEMMSVLLQSSDDTVVVIDPEGEYYPMAEMMGGEVIRIAAGADVHINPFDIDLDVSVDGEDDPMAIKSDFIVSMCETVVGEKYGLAPAQRSIIDRCVKLAYNPYLESRDPKTGKYDKSKLPTLRDFYRILRQQQGYDAMQLADGLELYSEGSLNVFAHHTNVEYSKRFVVFDIKDVGSTMKSMALLVVLDNIWNRMVAGRKEGRYTWFFVDEIYLLFKSESSAEFLRNLYKRARKYFGIPTGITQNVDDLLKSDIARSMISNCEYIQMLNQAAQDRAQLAELLNISQAQLGFVTNSNPGEGLIYNGRVIVPFFNKLPKDTKQYMAMTTKPSEVKERDAKKRAQKEEEERQKNDGSSPQDSIVAEKKE